MVDIRGSPFAIECLDPWQQEPVGGAALARRPGATLACASGDLILFGGDKSLAAVCHPPTAAEEQQQPWQWVPTAEAERPLARKAHAAAVVAAAAPAGGTGSTPQLLVCGGQALEGDPADLHDVRMLQGSGGKGAWEWQPAGAEIQLHQRPDGSMAPTERNSHCAAVMGSTLLIFGGEHDGQLLQELCLLDLSNKVGCSCTCEDRHKGVCANCVAQDKGVWSLGC